MPDLVAGWRKIDQAHRHPGGAPAKYGEQRDLIALALMVTLLLEGTPTQVEELRRAIMSRLSRAGLEMIGLPVGDRASQTAVYSRLRRAWDRLTDTFDMAPGRLGKHRPTQAEVEAVKVARDPDRCAEMAERARLVMARLLEASALLARPEDLATWNGNVTLDATVAPARGGGHRTKKPLSPTIR